jgi:hypothetical protein
MLQSFMQKVAKFLQVISNIIKRVAKTVSDIIRHLH